MYYDIIIKLADTIDIIDLYIYIRALYYEKYNRRYFC